MDPSVLPAGPLEPCSLAVPVRVAVSVTGSPKATGLGRPALVVSVGVTGLMRKHSLLLLSLDPGTPTLESPEKSARQQ